MKQCTEGGSPAGRNLALINETHLSEANKVGQPIDKPCLDSRVQVIVSRVRVFRVNSVSGARHRGRQPNLPESDLNTRDPLVGCRQSEAGLVTDFAWTPGEQCMVSTVRAFRVSSVSGTRQRGRQPSWP